MDIKRVSINKKPQINQPITWKSPEFVQFDRGKWWYIILVIVGVLLSAAFYFFGPNYLAIAVVVLAVVVLFILGKQKPKMRTFVLSNKSLEVNDKSYAIGEFKSYYITYVNNVPNLHLEKTKNLSTPVTAVLDIGTQDKVLDMIKTLLPENVKVKYTFNDTISNWFRF